jgi:elongation factor G
MTIYKSDKLRNVVILGHGGAGKTSLVEAMLFDTGAVNRLGRVDEAVVVLDSGGGVEVGTEQVWHYADQQNLPRLAFINKMERENVDYAAVVAQIASKFDVVAVPLYLPIGSQADLKGVVDLLAQKAYLGEKAAEAPIPAELADAVEEARLTLIEAAAEGQDELMEKYFEEETLTDEEILRGLKLRLMRGTLVPVLCGSAAMNIGVVPVMRSIIQLLPSPVEAAPYPAVNPATNKEMQLQCDAAGQLAALVFKTVADPYVGKLSYFRVYSGTLESDSRVQNVRTGSEERLGQLYTMRGKEQVPVARVPAGDIGGVARLSETETGDTLCDRGAPVRLPAVEYPSPLYSVAVSPKTKADAAKISPTLTRINQQAREKPSCQAWAIHTSTWRSGGWRRPLAWAWIQPSRGCHTRRPLPGQPRPSTATRSKRAVLASLPKSTCASNPANATAALSLAGKWSA